jgi:hypothetical protein
MGEFEKQVTSWARKSEMRLEAVFKTAVQDMVDDAQTPRDKGGRMPVDTGFLINSGYAAVNRMPSGNPPAKDAKEWTGANQSAAALAINKAKIGDTIYFGWTANYAQYMEAKYAFMRLAAQRWGQFVKMAARRIEQSGSGLK